MFDRATLNVVAGLLIDNRSREENDVQYLKFSMGYQDTGAVAEVTLSGVESDVFLVDNSNLSAFERGERFTYAGGHYKSSPVVLRVPSAGTWTVVVLPTGGRVQASVRTLAA